jgi:hypothetical protein
MEQKNNSVSIAVLTAKILTRDITKIDDINANIQDYDEKVTILYNLIVSEKELLDTATEQDRSHNQLQLLESAIDETRKNIQANNIMLAKYYFDRSIEYFKLIKNVNNKKSIEDTLESIRFEIQNMNDDNNDSNNEETVRQETYSQHVPHTTQSLMSPQPYEKTPLPNYSLHSPANFNEPSTSTQASTSNNLDITELWTQKIQAALQTEYYDDQVKEVFLYLINLALTYQQGTVYLTTYYNLKKLEQDLKSDIDLNDIYITFNLNDCDKITYLTLLAEKFLNKFRCQPNSLQDIVQAIQKYKDFINMSQEPLSIQNDFQEILQQNFDFDHLQPIKKSDYDNIKDKNVKSKNKRFSLKTTVTVPFDGMITKPTILYQVVQPEKVLQENKTLTKVLHLHQNLLQTRKTTFLISFKRNVNDKKYTMKIFSEVERQNFQKHMKIKI